MPQWLGFASIHCLNESLPLYGIVHSLIEIALPQLTFTLNALKEKDAL